MSSILILILYIFLMPLPQRKFLRTIYRINKVWITTWATLSGIRIKVNGAEHIKSDQDYVFISNHLNLLDIILNGSCIQHPFTPLIKKQLLKVPLLGQLLALTSVPVDRSSPESRKASFQRMKDTLARHISILIFPEGTRNRTEEPLKPFYSGAFRLAVEAEVILMPVVLLDIRKRQPVGTFRIYPGEISINFLEPIDTQGMDEDDVEALKQTVFNRMYEVILNKDSYFTRRVLS